MKAGGVYVGINVVIRNEHRVLQLRLAAERLRELASVAPEMKLDAIAAEIEEALEELADDAAR